MHVRSFLAGLGLLSVLPVAAQTFDMDQLDQLFRPRVRMELGAMPGTPFAGASGSIAEHTAGIGFTVPVHRKLSVSAQLDLTAKSWRELLERSVRIRASQVLLTGHYGARDLRMAEVLDGPRTLHGASLGLMGITLDRRLRVVFWSAQVHVNEEDRTFAGTVPRFTGLVGRMKVKGLRRNTLYGVAAGYSDGLAVPVPFYGGTTPLGKEVVLQYVLPLQAAVVWRPDAQWRLEGGLGLRADRSGLEYTGERVNFSTVGGRVFAGLRYKSGKHIRWRAEIAYLPEQRYYFGNDDLAGVLTGPRYPHGLRAMVGVDMLLGGNLLERLVEELIR